MSGDAELVLSLDVGTTKIKCQLLDNKLQSHGLCTTGIRLHYPQPGYVEIRPEELWADILQTIRETIQQSKISIEQIKCIGISTQRATFTTWRKSTKQPLHNFITWKDIRTRRFVKNVNNYWGILSIRALTYVLHLVTRYTKFYIASRMKLASTHTSVRLLWALLNIPELQQALQENDVMFGTLETWLLFKLTNGKTYVSEISNASATGLYDSFAHNWAIVCNLLGIPKHILPKVVGNDYDYGEVDPNLFGKPLKIGSVISDACSSMLGACCLDRDALKVTLGTGAFLNVNTGTKIDACSGGMYPIVLWKLGNCTMYASEVSSNDSGSLIEWALNAGLIQTPQESYELVKDTKDNGGVYYVAAFSGLGPPICNENAASGFLGIHPTTRKSHMIRALLESIVFRVALTVNHLQKDRVGAYTKLRIDGGVSANDFICQMLADTTGLRIERLHSTDLSLIGVGFLAGLQAGFWQNVHDIKDLVRIERTFHPSIDAEHRRECLRQMQRWVQAAKRFKSWYKNDAD